MIALASFAGIIGLAALMIFGRNKLPKLSRLASTILLVLVNVAFVVFSASVWQRYDAPVFGVLMLVGWFSFQRVLCDTAPPLRKPRQLIVMERWADPEEAANFTPDRYFRLRKSVGWRRLVLEIDDAIEIPDSTPIPTQDLGGGVFQNVGGQYLLVGGWISVLFEYKDQVFYGNMKL